MKRMTFYLGMALAVLSLASCRNGGKSIITPVSSGRPYEVMVVADDKCWMSPDSALFRDCLRLNALSVFRVCGLTFLTVRCVCSVTSLL